MTAEQDPDLARAYKLIELHRQIKTAFIEEHDVHKQSSALSELQQARGDVAKALSNMGPNGTVQRGKDTDREDQQAETLASSEVDDEDVSAWA